VLSAETDEPLTPITDEEARIICPTCSHPGYRQRPDDRGTLIRHPGRAWPCRVSPGVVIW
jgi:hypothetical protein